MNSLVKKGLYCGLFVAGLTLFGATAANASETTGEDSLLGGGIIEAIVELPVSVVDNAISVIGDSTVAPAAPATEPAAPPAAEAPAAAPAVTSGDDSLAGGNQAVVDAVAPITVTGNAITVIGDSSSSATSTAPAAAPAAPEPASTEGTDSILGGNQVLTDVLAPITVTGNSITLIGDSSSSGTTATTTPATAPSGSAPVTNGEDSIGGGNQVVPDLSLPVTVSGNSITLIGDSSSSGSTSTPAAPAGSVTPAETSGADSILGGTQVLADVLAPVTVTGNAITLVGDSSSTGGSGSTPASQGDSAPVTTGLDGLLGGNQLLVNLGLPVTVGGNAITVIGDSETTTPAGPAGPTDPTTPVDPTDPTTPTVPTTPTTPASPSSAGLGVQSSASGANYGLALTGVDSTVLMGGIAALLLLGLTLLFIGRRRSAN